MSELLVLLVICLLFALSCFGAIGWTLLSGVEVGIELIFLLHVGAVLGLIFLGIAAWLALRILPLASAKPETPTAPTAKPTAAK